MTQNDTQAIRKRHTDITHRLHRGNSGAWSMQVYLPAEAIPAAVFGGPGSKQRDRGSTVNINTLDTNAVSISSLNTTTVEMNTMK